MDGTLCDRLIEIFTYGRMDGTDGATATEPDPWGRRPDPWGVRPDLLGREARGPYEARCVTA